MTRIQESWRVGGKIGSTVRGEGWEYDRNGEVGREGNEGNKPTNQLKEIRAV